LIDGIVTLNTPRAWKHFEIDDNHRPSIGNHVHGYVSRLDPLSRNPGENIWKGYILDGGRWDLHSCSEGIVANVSATSPSANQPTLRLVHPVPLTKSSRLGNTGSDTLSMA